MAIIINELLTFVQNKIDVLDELSITQICATNFSEADIEDAKKKLDDALEGGSTYLRSRRGEDKKKKDIKDIIKAFKETDPKVHPCFVAKDLNRLPPVSFDHVDVTRLLKDLTIMKTELLSLRNEAALKTDILDIQTKINTDLSALRTSIDSASSTMIVTNTPKTRKNTPKKRVTTPKTRASNPKTQDTTPKKLTGKPRGSLPRPPMTEAPRTRLDSTELETTHTPNYRNIVIPKSTITSVDEDGYTKVVRKKRKSNLCGSAKCLTSTIQVAELPLAVYVSRLSQSTTADNIKEYIREKGEQCIEVQQLGQKYETSFRSFKILVPKTKLSVFLNNEFWPEGLKYRLFRERYNTAKNGNHAYSQVNKSVN
ncbi:hypothetical protein NE865_11408 [Phthorimaea operculella]|nr:hypothetical protein NE865_11408 [Phthorimaea operculella]